MPDWKLWRDMSRESLQAAKLLENSCIRSAISRYYYASYQASSALLLYRKCVPPESREAWSHESTPQLLKEQLKPLIRDNIHRNTLVSELTFLYKLRIHSDYVSDSRILEYTILVKDKIKEVSKNSRILIGTIEGLLPAE